MNWTVPGYWIPQIHNLFFGLDSISLNFELSKSGFLEVLTAEGYFCATLDI